MLQSINDRIKGVLGWAIVALISIPFMLWGIQSYLGAGGEKFMAKVNDVEITIPQFDRAVSQQRARMQEMFGKNMPISDVYDKIIKDQVLNQLITTEVLKQYALKNGFIISDQSLAAAIQSIEPFQENGQFSQELYERVINSQGMSLAGFESLYRNELSITQLRNALINSTFATDYAVATEWKLTNQSRNVSYIEFKQDEFKKNITVSDSDIEKHYQENSFRYMNPEQVSVRYVELTADNLATEIPVSEKELKKHYDAYVAAVQTNEQRKSRHILVNLASDAPVEEQKKAKEKIDMIAQQIKDGGDFSELAKKYSDDEGSASAGGDLGLVSKGMMVKPFEEALFELKKDQVSAVVRSEFGYHLIKLDSIETPAVESFASRKPALEKELKENAIQNLYLDRAEALANTAYENPEGLELVAERLNLKINTTELFTRASGKGIANNEKVRQAAFDNAVLKDGLNSDAIEISNRHVLVIRLNEHQPATAKSLAEVRAEIISELMNKQARVAATQAADEVAAQLAKDASAASWSTILGTNKDRAQSLNLVKRDAGNADRQIIESAFKLSRPESGSVSYQQLALANGNTAVVAITNVVDPADSPDKAAVDELKAQQARVIAMQEFDAFVAEVKSKADIYIPAQEK